MEKHTRSGSDLMEENKEKHTRDWRNSQKTNARDLNVLIFVIGGTTRNIASSMLCGCSVASENASAEPRSRTKRHKQNSVWMREILPFSLNPTHLVTCPKSLGFKDENIQGGKRVAPGETVPQE